MSKLIKEEERYRDPVSGELLFEKCFIPIKDEMLLRDGIEVCATTTRDKSTGVIQNRLLFRKDEKIVSQISCIHTKVCTFEKLELEDKEKEKLGMKQTDDRYAIISTEKRPEIREELGLEQNFIALKSFAGHIIERGIENILLDSMKLKLAMSKGDVDVDFSVIDDFTTSQLLKAISNANKKIGDDLLIFALDYMTGENPQRYDFLSTQFSEQICDLDKQGLQALNIINGGYNELSYDSKECLSIRDDLPSEIATILLKDKEPTIVRNVLRSNKSLPIELQQKFVTDKNLENRKSLASNSHLADEIELKLANDPSLEVQQWLVRRTFLKKKTIDALIKSPYSVIRQTIALNPKTNISQLNALSRDQNVYVRRQIGLRDDINLEILERLSKDEDNRIRNVILQNHYKELPSRILLNYSTDIDDGIRQKLAESPRLPHKVELKLIEDSEFLIRHSLSQNPTLSHNAINLLASDPHKKIRMAIARNPITSLEVLSILSHDSNPLVRSQAKERMK